MNKKFLRFFFLATLFLIGYVTVEFAQTTGTVELVAYDKQNQTVKDLSPNDFELRMDGHPVDVRSLKLQPKRPPRVILLVDTGYSALNNRPLLKDIVTAFIDVKPPQMEMALATINDVQQFLSPFQKSSDEIVSTLQKVKFSGSAPFSQSVLNAVARLDPVPTAESAKEHKVLITFSDGSDDSPSEARDQVQKMFRERNFTYYLVNHIRALKVIFDFKYTDKDLTRWAEETGGGAFRLSDLRDVGGVAREIFDRETNTYQAALIGDMKLSPNDRNRFKVKSRRKDVRIEVVAVH
jgi:VWFA-related protein